MYSLLRNISVQPFEKFISFCFENSDINHWFCYRVPEGYDIEVYLFTVTAESKRKADGRKCFS